MSTRFDQCLQFGALGENQIAQWLIAKGYLVLPAYEVEMNHGKGPRLFSAQSQLISPDLLVFNSSRVLWIEAKTKSAFTWHRLSSTWQTGIDRRHWRDYLLVAQQTPWDVWLLFLHLANGTAKDTPEGLVSPSGLFGNNIRFLEKSVHHESDNHGKSGMVYWTIDALRSLAPSTEFQQNQRNEEIRLPHDAPAAQKSASHSVVPALPAGCRPAGSELEPAVHGHEAVPRNPRITPGFCSRHPS